MKKLNKIILQATEIWAGPGNKAKPIPTIYELALIARFLYNYTLTQL